MTILSKNALRSQTLWSMTPLSIALMLLASSSAYATNGYFASGYGVKNDAVAGAGTAFAQDALTIAVNPAGLTEVGQQLNVGLDLFSPDRSASINGNVFGPNASYSGNRTHNFLIPSLGYSQPISPDVSLGLAIYGNGGMNTDYATNPYSRYGASGAAGVNLEQLFVSPAIAWKINDHNSVGLAANLAYQRFTAKGIGIFSGFSNDPSAVSDQGNDDSYGAGVRLGWIGKINDAVSLGASWQSKTRMGKLDKYAGLFAGGGRFDIPETYALGIAVKPVQQLTLAFDWQRILYHDVAAVGNSFAALQQGYPLGDSQGPGFGWRDISVYKLGAIWQANDRLTLRGGFSYNQQPIPSGETFFNILAPGAVQKHLTLGASWKLNTKDEISASYIHAFNQQVHGSASIPPGFPPAGLGGGNADIELQEDVYGLAWSHAF